MKADQGKYPKWPVSSYFHSSFSPISSTYGGLQLYGALINLNLTYNNPSSVYVKMQRNRKHNKDKNKVNRTTEKLSFFPPLTCIINGFLIKFYLEKNIKKRPNQSTQTTEIWQKELSSLRCP